jgi:hypothetical protein
MHRGAVVEVVPDRCAARKAAEYAVESYGGSVRSTQMEVVVKNVTLAT